MINFRGTESAGAQSAQEGDERKKEEYRQHRAPRQRLQGDPKAVKKGDRPQQKNSLGRILQDTGERPLGQTLSHGHEEM